MIQSFWQEFLSSQNLELPLPNAWMFGDETKEMGDVLGQLVLDGIKTATCSAYDLYQMEGEALPTVGQYDIILNGDREPIAVIQTIAVSLVKMKDVTPEFAKKEGEGDLSYRYWFDIHEEFFTKSFQQIGLTFDTEKQLVCEEFKVLYKK